MRSNKTREKSHLFSNSWFMLTLVFRASPSKVFLQFGIHLLITFFYNFVYTVWFLRRAVELITGGGSFGSFLLLLGGLVCAKLFTDFVQHWYFEYYNEQQNLRVESYINRLIFAKAAEMELACYENPEFYDKLKRAGDTVSEELFREVMYNLSSTFSAFITAISISVYIVSVDPRILLVALVSFAMMGFSWVRNRLNYRQDKEKTSNERQKDYIKRTVFLKDFAKEIKTTNMFDVLQEQFRQAVERNRAIYKKYGWKFTLFDMLVEFVSGLLPNIGGYAYACYRFLVLHNLAIADFSVLLSAITRFKRQMGNLTEFFSTAHKQGLYIQNLRELLEYEPSLQGGGVEPPAMESLEFRGVSFRYGEGNEPVLQNISFTIRKGERIAIVGHNGAGKSTLSKLFLRLYDASEGEILLNGVPLREFDLAQYRRKFATVFQDYQIFSLPVTENVLMREYAGEDTQSVEDALRRSGAQKKVETLPNGIHTLLTKEFDDEGASLSGGEGQKVAIARLFAREFEIALLDEPSSALDPVAEHQMYESLFEATKDKTVVYISHRLSSAALSDRVLVFEEGELIEAGSHGQLMRDEGKYAQMFTMQAQNYRAAGGKVTE